MLSAAALALVTDSSSTFFVKEKAFVKKSSKGTLFYSPIRIAISPI
jgi:hypothetical protein